MLLSERLQGRAAVNAITRIEGFVGQPPKSLNRLTKKIPIFDSMLIIIITPIKY